MKISIGVFVSLLSLLSPLRATEVSPFPYPLTPFIAPEEIAARIQQVSEQLQQDYANQELCVVVVLKGALWFATDLIKALKIPNTMQTISCSSYGFNGTVAGELEIRDLDMLNITNQHVLVVDDICDTGQTLSMLVSRLEQLSPKSLKTMTLLLKDTTRSKGYIPDYHLFRIQDVFVVGYGLDYKEYYRGLPGICVLEYSDTPAE